ncbi:integrase, catalytic region, zinc finger, CCHC-type containing protein [Tanacetum coccineum]
MLAPGNYVQWKSRIKRYIDTKPNNELIHYCLQNPPYKFKWTEKTVPVADCSSETTTEGYMENYKNVSQDIRDQLNAKAEAVQIILTGIDNDIYSTVDACPNACEMWKAIERLKQSESINVQDLETNLYWEFRKFTSRDGESLESYYSRFYKMMNELVRNQCDVTNHQVNVQFLLQLQPEWQRFVTLVKQSQELKIVSYHKLYDILKQNQNKVNEIRAERLARNANPPALVAQQQLDKEIDKLMALISLSFKKVYKPTNNNLRTSSNTSRANQDNSLRLTEVLEQADWRDDTDDKPEDRELEAHYYDMVQIKMNNGDTNITIDSLEWVNNGETVDQDDNDDLAKERDLLASLIEKLKCEIDDSKNYNKFLETSNKALVENLKDLKKFQAELDRYHDVNYASKVEINCAKAKGDLMSYKMESEKSSNEYTRKINDLKQTISDMKKELFAHQETISIMLQEKEAQISFSNTVYTEMDEVTNLQCDYLEALEKCERLEKELSNSKSMSKSFEELQKLVQGNITIKRVYYVKGLNHNLFSVGQFCDADLEVAFQKSTCYIRDLKGNEPSHRPGYGSSSLPSKLRYQQLASKGKPNEESIHIKTTPSSKKTVTTSTTWTYVESHLVVKGIEHQTSTARTPEKNSIVERRNRTLVEAARTMLSAAKVPLFFWAEAIATTYGENLDKMKEKGDACIFVGYSTQSRAYRVYNNRIRVIVETIHVNFDELPKMASDHVSSDPVPQCPTTALEHDSLSPGPQSQENVPQSAETVTTSNELDLLFSPMFRVNYLMELLKLMSKSPL